MSNTPISGFTSGAPAQSGDEFVIARSGANYKLTTANLATYMTTGLTSLTLGTQSTSQGSLILSNTNVGAFPTTLQSSNSASAAWTLTLPVTAGSNGFILTTNGSGVTSWTNPTALGVDLDIGTTAITGGTSGRILYNNAGVLGELATTGTGNVVLATSPSLTTPTIGAATAASINKVAITAPATNATLTIAEGKTFTASNTLTLAGTDSTTMTFPTTSATIARTDAGQTFTGNQTITEAVGGSGLTITGAAQTTSQPVLNLSQTWNASGVTFTGLKFNATDTASAIGSLLLDLQTNTGGAPTSRFSVRRDGVVTTPTKIIWGGGSLGENGSGAISVRATGNYSWSNDSTGLGTPDTILTRAAAATLQLGAADTSASATVTITIATPGVVTWSSHGLSTGTPVIFSTTGALPTGITAGTTYYVIAVDANTFQIATSYANSQAGTAVNTSGSQSGTQTGTRGAIDQMLRVQSASGTTNFPGADFAIQGSRGTGTGAGGSLIFQVAPAGSSGTAQNAYATALTIDPIGLATFAASITNTGSAYYLNHTGALETRGFRVVSTGSFGFSSGVASAAADTLLLRDAANTLALRGGTTNQGTVRIYNLNGTTTDYSRLSLSCGTLQSLIPYSIITSEAGGTGLATGLQFGAAFPNSGGTVAQTNVFYISTTGSNGVGGSSAGGHMLWNTDNTYDIGASGASRPRNVYVANSITTDAFTMGPTATFIFGGRARIRSPSTTDLQLWNSTSDGFGSLMFGGTTSSFPALKRSSASLICRLADDSANAAFEALSLKTGAPTGGTSGTWKVGVYNATAPSATGYVEVDIGGTLYKLLAST